MSESTLVDLFSRSQALLWTADRSLRLNSIVGLRSHANAVDDDKWIGSCVTSILPPGEFHESLVQAHRRALEGHSARFEIAIAGRHWLGRVEPLVGHGNEIEGITAAVFDDTERAFAERSLRLSEQSYRSLIEDAPFGIARVTSGGQLLQVNRAMVEMLRYESEQELLVCSVRSEVFATEKAYDEFVNSLSLGEPLQGLESVWRRRDGKPIPVSLAGRATRDEQGRISYIEILAENITDRKQLEHQLRQAQKLQAVGQLAGGIAHDFNNLLTIINGQVQMALGELSAGDPLRERLEDVESAASRASKLTRQLLTFGRMQPVEAKALNVNSVVSGLTPMLTLLIGKSIQLEFSPSPDLGYVTADPAQLEQVAMNLVLNARDATPDGGRVLISTENVKLSASSARDPGVAPPGDYVALSVVDNGHGMSQETLARIFEPFFTTKKMGMGTGLGLATVYSIVKQCKGFIGTESELGEGSRFTVYLPLATAPARAESPASPVPLHGGSETILIAEDEEIIRRFTSSFLSGLGYKVLCAADGIDALAIAGSHAGEISLLITDIVMPRLGGRELAKELRRTMPAIKILFISGFSGDDNLRDGIRELNARILQKPFPSMPAFAKSIRDLLDQPR